MTVKAISAIWRHS